MKRTKLLTKISIVTLLLTSIFCTIPLVSAKTQIHGFPGYMAKEHFVEMTPYPWFFPFPPATAYKPDLVNYPAYFSAHLGYTAEEKESGTWPVNPYQIKLFIDNEEIVLRRFHYYQKEIVVGLFDANSHNWIFTQNFDVGFFEAGGEYEVRVEYWVKKPYLDDDSNEWRIFNYFGVPWIFTYTLIIDVEP